VITIGVADFILFRKRGITKNISYDRLDLLAEAKRDELESDLRNRFGITGITKIQIGNIDTIKGRVVIKVHIIDPENNHFQE
ncbi:MAG: DUF4956 domain-containing protein, partial [Bacteroidetes bacterium]|nr:DUF4956 domain-containing protein [Bacteroidota bacterium]